MYVDFAAFSLETVKERFAFKVILFVSTFKEHLVLLSKASNLHQKAF